MSATGFTDLQITTRGKLSVRTKEDLKRIRSKFLKSNNEIAAIVQNEDVISARTKVLRAKKKELTRKLDDELKELKADQRGLTERRLVAMGERVARIKDLAELGASVNEVPQPKKKLKAHKELVKV